jgi:hypothetical protein
MGEAYGADFPATYGSNCSFVKVPAEELWQLLVSVSESLRYVAMGAAPSPTVTVCRCGEWHWASATSVGRHDAWPEHEAPPTTPSQEGQSSEMVADAGADGVALTEWTAVGKGREKSNFGLPSPNYA